MNEAQDGQIAHTENQLQEESSGHKATFNLQQNNTYINGESVSIVAVLSAIPESDREWAKNRFDIEQQSRISLVKEDQRLHAEFNKKEQDRQDEELRSDERKALEEMRLRHKSSQYGKTCALICVAIFVTLIIVCVIHDKVGWGIAATIGAIITVITAFTQVKPEPK